MRISEQIKNLKEVVTTLLTNDKRYRDSDKKLSAKIWSIQFGGHERLKNMSAYEFLCEYAKDDTELLSQESIGRARRKLQEENPELRGSKYQEKQEEQQEVLNVLGYGKK